jgi:hypothetical protein
MSKMCFWGEMMQNHHNKTPCHGISEFTVMDMGGVPCHQPNLLKLIMVHQPPIAMKDAPMSMMLKLGALPMGTAIMVCRGDGMKNTVLHKC